MEGGRIVQIGTPREIFSNPASEYVADFVANMNPLGVLTARDVMEPARGQAGQTVSAETPVADLIAQLDGKDAQLDVTEDGKRIGIVTAPSIIERLKNEA